MTPDRRPVPAFTVKLFTPSYDAGDAPAHTEPVASPFGTFDISWSAAGPVDLAVNAPGFTETVMPHVELAPSHDEAAPWEVTLVPEARIRGQVVTVQGQPVSGAAVELAVYLNDVEGLGEETEDAKAQAELSAYLEASNPNPRQRTGADGRFELAGLPQGTYQLVASHPDYFPTAEEVRLQPGRVIEPVQMVLSREGGRLLVRVLDHQDGAMVRQPVGIEETPIRGVTDDQGVWRAKDLPPGVHRVILSSTPVDGRTAVADRWSDAPVVAGKETVVTFRVAPGIVVRGEVTRGDRPVADAEVTAGQMNSETDSGTSGSWGSYATAAVRTDARGLFELPQLPAGEYQLRVVKGEDVVKVQVRLAALEHDRTLRLRLGDGELTGIVQDGGTRQPVAGASVSLFPLDLEGNEHTDDDVIIASNERQARTGVDGRYRLDGLAPGTYALEISAPGYGRIANEAIRVSPAQAQHDAVLWPNASLILTVTDRQHIPIQKARVTMTRLNTPDNLFIAATDSNGLVQVDDLAPDTYEVQVELPDASGPPSRMVTEVRAGSLQRLAVTLERPAG